MIYRITQADVNEVATYLDELKALAPKIEILLNYASDAPMVSSDTSRRIDRLIDGAGNTAQVAAEIAHTVLMADITGKGSIEVKK